MSVHYKFKSGKEAHTITFDSLHITVGELKKAIMQQRKIGKTADLDLQITNAQTKEVYESESILIPKNTSVIVARVPVANVKKSWNKNESNNKNDMFANNQDDKISKNFNTASGSEDDKIKEMLTLSTKDYDPSKYARGKGPLGPLPPNYTCYRCGKPGHYIKHCPTNNIDVKRSTGIPRSFMIPAKADQKGAMITASGDYAVPIIDHDAYKEVKKEKPPFFPTENEPEIQKIEIPDDLKCSLCQNLLQDAVLIPCCGNSFCDECIRLFLLDSDNHECYSCHETNVSPDTLIPNRYLRLAVAKFKNETGFGNTTVPAVDKKKTDLDKEDNEIKPKEDSKNNQTHLSESPGDNKNEASQSLEKDSNLISKEQSAEEKTEQSKEVDLDEVFNKGESSEELNDKELDTNLNSQLSEREALMDKNKQKSEHLLSNEIEKDNLTGNSKVGHPIESSQLPIINTNHTLQPPFAMNYNNNNGVGRYRNQIRVRSSGQAPNILTRAPGQMLLPRNNYNQSRPLLTHESAFYNDPMQQFPQMGLALSYGYGSQIRNPMFDNMYNLSSRGGQINPLMPYPNNMNPLGSLNGHSMSVMDSENSYYPYKYDDYEDKIERFNRHLESKSRRYTHSRRKSRSRSRSVHSKSRSRSYSSASSRSSSRSRKSSRSRRRSPSRHGRRERSRSRSSHRYHKSSYSRHRSSHSHSKYDKRSDRIRSDREKKHKSVKREKDIHRDAKESVDRTIRKSREKYVDSSKENKIEEDITKIEENPSSISLINTNLIDLTNKDSEYVDTEVKPDIETRDEDTKIDGKCKSNIKSDKSDLDTKEKTKRKDRHSKNKTSRSRSRSESYSSDSSSDRESKIKKKHKKSSKDVVKSKHSEKGSNSKNKSKNDSKSAEQVKSKSSKLPSKEDKSSKHSKDSKHKKQKESELKNKSKSASVKKDKELNEELDDSKQLDSLTETLSTNKTESEYITDKSAENEQSLLNKSDEMEIKIQEDYSDLENEMDKNEIDCPVDKSVNILNNQDVSKTNESKFKEVKTNEESLRKVKISSFKLAEKPSLSVTIENKVKIGSKVSLKEKDEDNKVKEKSKDKDKKSDKHKERSKDKEKDSKGSKDRHKNDHYSSHKGDSHTSSSKSSKSKDKKKSDGHRSKRSHRKSRSRSGSVSPRKKIKSEIDSYKSSKHKSSKSHRK